MVASVDKQFSRKATVSDGRWTALTRTVPPPLMSFEFIDIEKYGYKGEFAGSFADGQ